MVNDALRAQVERDRRLTAMDAFIGAFEAADGEITDAEIAAADDVLGRRAGILLAESGTATSSTPRSCCSPPTAT